LKVSGGISLLGLTMLEKEVHNKLMELYSALELKISNMDQLTLNNENQYPLLPLLNEFYGIIDGMMVRYSNVGKVQHIFEAIQYAKQVTYSVNPFNAMRYLQGLEQNGIFSNMDVFQTPQIKDLTIPKI
jgi:hypothetical protein